MQRDKYRGNCDGDAREGAFPRGEVCAGEEFLPFNKWCWSERGWKPRLPGASGGFRSPLLS